MSELMKLKAQIDEALSVVESLKNMSDAMGIRHRPMATPVLTDTVQHCLASLHRLDAYTDKLRYHLDARASRHYRDLESTRLLNRIKDRSVPTVTMEQSDAMARRVFKVYVKAVLPSFVGNPDEMTQDRIDRHFVRSYVHEIQKDTTLAEALTFEFTEVRANFFNAVYNMQTLKDIFDLVFTATWADQFQATYSKNLCPGFGLTKDTDVSNIFKKFTQP